MIFQDPMTSLNPTMKVGQQITETLRYHEGLSGAAARAKAIELLERVQIPDARARVDHYPFQFSGGMRQRVMIAMAIACNPKILIADEPTTALDVTVQAQILDLLRDLQREHGMAIVLITHDLGVVAQMADEVAVMYAGQIVEQGSVDDVFYRPAHPYTLGLQAVDAAAAPSGPRGRLEPIEGSPPDLFSPPAGCAYFERCPWAMEVLRTPTTRRSGRCSRATRRGAGCTTRAAAAPARRSGSSAARSMPGGTARMSAAPRGARTSRSTSTLGHGRVLQAVDGVTPRDRRARGGGARRRVRLRQVDARADHRRAPRQDRGRGPATAASCCRRATAPGTSGAGRARSR